MTQAKTSLYPEADWPMRDLADVEALERVPLAERLWSHDVNDWIERGMRLDPGKTALTFCAQGRPDEVTESWSYAQLDQKANRYANVFRRLGVSPQDVVLYLLPTSPSMYAVMLGAMRAGIGCCINWMLKPAQLLDLIKSSRAKVIVAMGPTPDFDIWERLESLRDQIPAGVHIVSARALPQSQAAGDDIDVIEPSASSSGLEFVRQFKGNDVAAYIHSGGTTGSPKLVQITHSGLAYKCWANAVVMGHSEHDVIFADYPMFHIAGFLSRGILALSCGMGIVIPSAIGARDKSFMAHYWDFIERYKITVLSGVPTTLSVLVKNPPQGQDLSSLRPYMCTGSTALPVEVGKAIEAMTGVRVLLTYGGTEYTQNVTQGPKDGLNKHGSVGIRLPYAQFRVAQLDPHGQVLRDCQVDEIGVVLLHGPNITPGYVDPYYNLEAFTRDGWFNSGDLGRLDSDGYLWITGRAKDLIIRGGHNIDPMVIEEAMRSHPQVMQAVAVGKPDAHAGELPVVYVQLESQARATSAQLLEFAQANVPEQAAVPKDVHVLDAIPLTVIGKADKTKLRQDAALRVFRPLLQGALGESVLAGLEFVDDAQKGQTLCCHLRTHPSRQGECTQQVQDIMKPYTTPYQIRWIDGDSTVSLS